MNLTNDRSSIANTPFALNRTVSASPFSLFSLNIALLIASLFLTLSFTVTTAYADVRSDDLICGISVDDRGLAANNCPNISADFAMVMDKDGKVYFERNAQDSAQIASVTKIMTAIVTLDAIESGVVTEETPITVTQKAALIGESTAGLREGDIMDLKTALMALLIPSGNDAAEAIAWALGQLFIDNGSAQGEDPEAAFVAMMNSKASEIGCTNTVFNNPHGLDYDEYEGDLHSCAQDICLISQNAMANQMFREIVAMGDSSIKVRRGNAPETIELASTDDFPKIYDYAIGIKTGFTDLAGSCFAGASNFDGKELYAAILHASDNNQRFVDASTLCQWVYDNEITYPLATSAQTVSYNGNEVPLAAEIAHTGWTDKTVKACLRDPSASIDIFALNGNVSQDVSYKDLTDHVHQGDVVGSITFMQHNEKLTTMDLIACEDVKAPNIFQSIGIWFTRQFSSGEKQATSVLYNETPLIIDKSQPGK